MRDEDDRAAIVAERAQHAPQLLNFRRREHRRRLVEDENARAAHERLQNLDALLLANAQLAHELAHVHPKAAALCGGRDLALGSRHVDREPARRLAAEDHVLGDREGWYEHEVLMHHPDARADRLRRAPSGDVAAGDFDGARVGRIDPREDAHHRRLPCAVLADQRVDLAGGNLE